jgi:hypothetical protein
LRRSLLHTTREERVEDRDGELDRTEENNAERRVDLAGGAARCSSFAEERRMMLKRFKDKTRSARRMLIVTALGAGVALGTTLYAVLAATSPPDFTITANAKLVAYRGYSQTFTVSISPLNGFTDPVTLSVSGLPKEATATFTKPTVTAASPTSNLIVTTTTATPTGDNKLTITGTSGSLVHAVAPQPILNVAALPKNNFTLDVTPIVDLAVPDDNSASYAVAINRTSFTGAVTLAIASQLPDGMTASFSPSVTSGSSAMLTLTPSASTPTADYTFAVSGISGSYTIMTTPLPLKVGKFALTSSPTSVTTTAGSSATYNVSIVRHNFGAMINLSVYAGLPAGATAAFNPDRTTGTGSVLTVATSASTPPGTYRLTLKGQTGNSPVHLQLVNVLLVISQPQGMDFTIAGSASGVLYPGGAARSIPLTISNPNSVPIYVTSLTVTPVLSNLPAGCDAGAFQANQSNVSSTNTVTVPANGSTTLPAGTVSAPTIRLSKTPTNQDACRNASFTLSFAGSAHS